MHHVRKKEVEHRCSTPNKLTPIQTRTHSNEHNDKWKIRGKSETMLNIGLMQRENSQKRGGLTVLWQSFVTAAITDEERERPVSTFTFFFLQLFNDQPPCPTHTGLSFSHWQCQCCCLPVDQNSAGCVNVGTGQAWGLACLEALMGFDLVQNR